MIKVVSHRGGLRTTLVLFLSLLVASLAVFGQERVGQIAGTATDQSGAVLPGVSVTITNKASARALSTVTGGDGAYIIRDVEPGRYSVKFDAKGFNAIEYADVSLLVGRTVKLDASLKVGGTEQMVEVSAAAPLIDTASTAIAHNVTAEEFDRLPKARSFQSLATASPSVNTGDIEGGFQVNGASGAENQFVVDGISTNSLVDGRSRQNAAFEFLSEVQVKTGGIDAEYGGAMGGVISAITKSGGNKFHGDGHFYYSGNKISAGPVKRLLLSPVDDKTVSYQQDYKNPLNNYEVGYSLGGYLIKDKLWFFSAASPRWARRDQTYIFSDNVTDTFHQKQLFNQAFNKISWDPFKRVRTNFSYLWTPTRSTGTLFAYNNLGNQNTSGSVPAQIQKGVGYSSPQSNYSGQVDVTTSATSMLSIRSGRFWDNFKTTGIPATPSVTYQISGIGLPFDIPANLRQPIGYYNTPRTRNTEHDLTTRTYISADFSKSGSFAGYHTLKVGIGRSKTVNSVNDSYPGDGFTYIYWDRSYKSGATGLTQRGTYGYYEVDNQGTVGSTGAGITSMYIQDQWRIRKNITLSLGLRTEKEVVPSFKRSIKDPAFEFPFQDKLAPRLGGSWDIFSNGKVKVYGSWGRFYDWVKYELARGTFGGDVWTIKYRSLDTTDVFSLNWNNAPGKNLWSENPNNPVRDRRVPGFDLIDPNIKPMYTDLTNAGVEFQLNPQTVLKANYVHNSLGRTIEDLGVLVDGNEVYKYANPGSGIASQTPSSGLTKPFPTPKPVRKYDALELTASRRFARNFFFNASYVYSRLYGNYAGLASSDEINTPTTGVSSATTQQSGGSLARPGSSATRYWDLDEILWDSHGNLDVLGRLATDRPHVLKLYGSYNFKFGTEIGGFYSASSGTPISTYVNTLNTIPVFVNGRGDLGRTPTLTQTDLVVAHEVKLSESKRLRFEFNALNVFNQKTPRHFFNVVNRGAGVARPSSAIDLSGTDLAKGYDYNALILKSADGKNAYDPRFGSNDLFNAGFSGRLGVKFIF